MATPRRVCNRVAAARRQHHWTQSELADRAGISRSAVGAIEAGRLSPSVTAALALARVFDTSVEELFRDPSAEAPDWAWQPKSAASRFWSAEVHGRQRLYPCEETPVGEIPHDGLAADNPKYPGSPLESLVLAGCDPAAGLLATALKQSAGIRLLPLLRSSRSALSLLQQGVVHVAGVHLATDGADHDNAAIVARELGSGYRLVRLADWEAGITLTAGAAARSVRSVVRSKARWVGREPGSGARLCLDALFSSRRSFRHVAYDHRGVAAAIRSGWADAGVCLRLVSAEAGQQFLPLHWESYDLCFPATAESDPRIRALLTAVRAPEFRRLLGELPGYDTRHTGEIATA